MRILATIVLVLVFVGAIYGGAELVMQDGQVLEGVDVRRDGDLYLLTQEGGAVVTVPFQFVAEVRLSQQPKPDPISGLTDNQPQTLAGDPRLAAGVVNRGPQVLAGEEIRAPRPSEQTAALGPPSRFQKNIIDPSWHPSSDWKDDPENNNWSPATWSKSVVDSDWTPSSDYDSDPKNNDFNPSSWSEGVVQDSWAPKDGFKSSVGNQ